MNRWKVWLSAGALALLVCGAVPARAAEPEAEADKVFYALGLMISENLSQFKLSPAELEIVKAGLTDGIQGKVAKTEYLTQYQPKIRDLGQSRKLAVAEEHKKAGKAFVDKAVAEEGATRKESGLAIKTLQEGSGASPTPEDRVKVHYTGKLIDGTVFDSSVERGSPAEFALGRVIKCWTEGLQLMKKGGKSRLYCPAEIAYGDGGRPKIPPGATLVFDVELLEINPPAATPAPAD